VSQSAQFAESGNAQARLNALSDAFSPALNLAALSRLIQPNAARKSLEFMRGAESTSRLKKGGFSPPAEKP